MIFDRHAELKYRYRAENLVSRVLRGHVGRNKEQIAEYIRKQIKEDYSADQPVVRRS